MLPKAGEIDVGDDNGPEQGSLAWIMPLQHPVGLNFVLNQYESTLD